MDTIAIVNPVAGSHSVAKEWEHIRDKIQQAGLEFERWMIEACSDATDNPGPERLMRRAVTTGASAPHDHPYHDPRRHRDR